MNTERRARGKRGQRDGAYTGPPLETPAQVRLAVAIAEKGLQVGTDLIRPEHRLHGVWVIPRALVSRGDVSHAAVLVYSVLYSLRTCITADGERAPDPFISQAALARETGQAVRVIAKAVRELAAVGYLKIHKSYSTDRTLFGRKPKTFHRYELLPVEGVNFQWQKRGVPVDGGFIQRPIRQHLAPPLLFIPRWLAVRTELQPTAKLIYSLMQWQAGVSSKRKRREWVAVEPPRLAGCAGMRGQKRAGKDGPVFENPAKAAEQVRRNIRTLKAHGLLVPFERNSVCFPVHKWRVEYFTETLPRELEARAERARARAVENAGPDMQKMPMGCAKYADYYQCLYQKGSEGSRGVTYSVEALKTVGEARRARNAQARGKRAAAREADPLKAEIRALVDGAITSTSPDGLNTDQARAVRDQVTDAALRHAKERGAEGRALVDLARYAQAYLDRALAADAVRGVRS